ncbi:MAG: hypothetical protein ACTSW1_08260 [Candidatus Hodarchaeales archaeon]
MALSNQINTFGVHQITIEDLITGAMFTMVGIQGAVPDLSQELIDLRTGSIKFPVASAPGEASGEVAITIAQYDAGVLEYFSPFATGAISEESSGDALGYVSSISNLVGTSVVNATTGIASIAIDTGNESDLKLGDYIAVAASATTIDIYVNTNINGNVYLDDALKITASPITIPDTGATVASEGVEYTGGSGTVGMTIGDKARFSVRPVNTYSMTHRMGMVNSSPKEFAMTIVGEQIGDKIRMVRYPKCIAGGGAGLQFPQNDWGTFETTVKLLQDSVSQDVGVETIINR